MARRPRKDLRDDPRVTDLRRYRRERERAKRAPRPANGPREPLLGGRRNAGIVLLLVIVVLVGLSLLSGHRF
jgi:hypothetical protein